MDASSSQTPDLASVLAQLREFAPAPPQNIQTRDLQPQTHQQPQDNVLSDGHRGPRQSGETISSAEDLKPLSLASNFHHPPADTTSIVDWPAGLRCVTKAAAQNSWFAESIQKMIRDQRHHESQWYVQRQNLKKQLASRGEGAKQAQDVLKSLGSLAKIDTPVMTVEEQEKELERFDAKIFKAQCDMANVMSAELKALGVPFFGTKGSLVVKNLKDTSDNAAIAGVKRPPMSSEIHLQPGQILETELVKLQRRMLEYLEDMYKE